jgi:hypothetical protein
MSGTLPTVHNGAVALYPVNRHRATLTSVVQFCDFSEQRWKERPPLFTGVLAYTKLSSVDRAALAAFFAAQKGQFDHTWNFVMAGVNYTNLCFTDDKLQFTESTPTLWSCTLNVRQTQARATPTPSVIFSYPLLSTGAVSQIPYLQTKRYYTSVNDQESGVRYAFAQIGAGLTGFPAAALTEWELNYPAVTDNDLATLETFFTGCNGRWATFTFQDPDDGTIHPKCRFGSDTLQITHIALNQNGVSLRVTETN